MSILWLRVCAPFAAFRWMQAGVWRATSPVMPHSAAWGLVLNLAGIETRLPGSGITTLIRPDAPHLTIAVGESDIGGKRAAADRASLYQQLHTYPVGNSGEELAEGTHGAKYWIAPTRREFLVGLDCVLGIQAEDGSLIKSVMDGLRGDLDGVRYGLPFAGDNNLLLDTVDILPKPPTAWWYAPLTDSSPTAEGSCRLTVNIDRANSARTQTVLFAPVRGAEPPAAAWINVGPTATPQ